MPTCPCGTEIERLDAKWFACPNCNACYPASPTRQDRMADVAVDADRMHRQQYDPSGDARWQKRERSKYGRDYTEPLLDQGEG